MKRVIALAVCALVTGGAICSPATAQAATVKPRVTMSIATREPEVGEKTKVTGAASGLKPGTKIAVQVLTGSKWKTISTVSTNRSGAYTASVKLTSKGAQRLRAVATSGKQSAVSGAVNVTAYGWRFLASRAADFHDGERTYVTDHEFGGDTWDYSWSTVLDQDSDSAADGWLVGGRCKKLSTIALLDDGSEGVVSGVGIGAAGTRTGSKVLATVRLDEEPLKPLEVDIRGMDLVSLIAVQSTETSGWSAPMFLSPMVLCSA